MIEVVRCVDLTLGASFSKAVVYKEWPDGGDYVDKGRRINAEKNMRYGIDINSHVDITIDKTTLKKELSEYLPEEKGSRAVAIRVRLEELNGTAKKINEAMKTLKDLFSLWDQPEARNPNKMSDVRNKIRVFSSGTLDIIKSLENAIESRLRAQGLDKDTAKKEKENIMMPVFTNEGYNWGVLTQLFQKEISFLDDDLEKLIPEIEKLDIEVYAHFVRISDTEARVPIHLPGYNEVKECIPTPVEKLTFSVPEGQLELYKKLSETVKTMAETKSIAEALQVQLESKAREIKGDINNSFEHVENALKKAGDSINILEYWIKDNNAKMWISEAHKIISDQTEKDNFIKKYNELENVLVNTYQDAIRDIQLLKSYADLKQAFADSSPESTMLIIMRSIRIASVKINAGDPSIYFPDALNPLTWEKRNTEIQKFIDSINDAAKNDALILNNIKNIKTNGRNLFTDVENAFKSVTDVKKELIDIIPEVRSWLGKVLGLPPILAAIDLQPPPSQKRLNIADNLDTSFDLTRICGEKKEFDTVRVTYRFFKGKELLNVGWYNDFQLRMYGWKDKVIAGISFTRQNGTTTYKPTATLSYILNFTCWPKERMDSNVDPGVGKKNIELFSGFGITTMPLDFDQTQDMEIGFTFTLSFFYNKILVGYGENLQAEKDRRFIFFSINLLDTPGMITHK